MLGEAKQHPYENSVLQYKIFLSDAVWIRYGDNFLFLVFDFPKKAKTEKLISRLRQAMDP